MDQNLTSPTQTGTSEQDLVNRLFSEIFVLKPAAEYAYRGDRGQEKLNRARKLWLEAFKENKINTLELLEAGLRMARRDPEPYMPTVGQFIKWCRSEDETGALENFMAIVGLGSKRQDWCNAHPILFWCYTEIGPFEVKRMKLEQLENAFQRVYKKARRLQLENGMVFVPPERQLENKSGVFVKESPKKVAEEGIAKLRDIMGMGPSKHKEGE